MSHEARIPPKLREWFDEVDDIMDVAVKKAIEENKRLGIDMGVDSVPSDEESETPTSSQS